MFLDAETFRTVVGATPLVSIDLVVENEKRQFLLGLRKNRPAKAFWFVPGGRILKGERLADAFSRLLDEEIGCVSGASDHGMLGVYEHFYEDSVFGDNPSTHYVVLAWHIRVRSSDLELPTGQHACFRWWHREAILESDNVHPNSRAYLTCGELEMGR